MEFVRIARKLGNSAGVLLPKKLLGSEVKIIVINKPIDIKKEVLKLVEEDLEDVLGIYLINKKPTEVLVITSSIKKVIEENIKLSFVPLNTIKKDLKNILLRKKLENAEVILNKALLKQLLKNSYNKL